MIREMTERLAGAIFVVLCLSGNALAGQIIWSPEDQPNILVRWWINTKYRMGAGFPAFVWMLAVVGIGLAIFIVNVARHRSRMKAMNAKEETLTTGGTVRR